MAATAGLPCDAAIAVTAGKKNSENLVPAEFTPAAGSDGEPLGGAGAAGPCAEAVTVAEPAGVTRTATVSVAAPAEFVGIAARFAYADVACAPTFAKVGVPEIAVVVRGTM